MADQDNHMPNLEAPDFQNTLAGTPPGNTAAEHGTLPGAAPEAVTEGRTPDDVQTADPAQLAARRDEVLNEAEQQAASEKERQDKDYTGEG
jgi:hypothetical protein